MEERNDEMLEFMITAILADYDLMGLIARGAPHDEYGPEARTILRYLIENDYDVKLDTLAFKIQYILEIWFSVQFNLTYCTMMANEIKKML